MLDFQWLLSRLSLSSLFDILVVAVVIYWLLGVAQGTRAALIIRGMAILTVCIWLVSRVFELTAVGWLLGSLLPILLISIPIIFQPELRRLLEQIGHFDQWIRVPLPASQGGGLETTVNEISKAAAELSRSNYGALIVIERETGLLEYADRGVPLDAAVTRQLLVNLFFPNSPLHDGAALIRQDRILAAQVVLPLSENVEAGGRLGTRHQAAIGITEESDALAVIVSEETGRISVAHNGRLVENLDQERLRRALRTLLRLDKKQGTNGKQGGKDGTNTIRRRIRIRSNGKANESSESADQRSATAWEVESDG